MSFPHCSWSEKSACDAGDTGDSGSITGSGRSLEKEMATRSCLTNPTDTRAWWLQSRGSQSVGYSWETRRRLGWGCYFLCICQLCLIEFPPTKGFLATYLTGRILFICQICYIFQIFYEYILKKLSYLWILKGSDLKERWMHIINSLKWHTVDLLPFIFFINFYWNIVALQYVLFSPVERSESDFHIHIPPPLWIFFRLRSPQHIK